MNQSKFTFYSLLGLIGVLVVINVYFSSRLSHLGLALSLNQQKVTQLTESTQKIRREIMVQNSLSELASKADQLGFIREVEYFTLTGSTVVAYKP